MCIRDRGYTRQVNPVGDPGDPITFTVDAEDSVPTVASRLHEAGLVSSVGVFEWYVSHHGGLQLTPGYYVLRPNDHMGNIMRILRTPPSETYTKVTFPEGYTYEKMGLRLADKVPRLSAVDFNVAASDGTITSPLLPVGSTSLEGLLFPDTYQVSNSETAAQLVQRMVHLTERVAEQEDITTGSAAMLLTPYQVLIIASIIEREAKLRAPVDTGALRGSISVDPIPMGADVGPHVDYGAYVEFGTVNTPAQPYLVPAADATRSQVSEIVRREIAGGKW